MALTQSKFITALFLGLLLGMTGACAAAPAPTQGTGSEPAMEHHGEGEEMEHAGENNVMEHDGDGHEDDKDEHKNDDHEHNEGRVPNDGAIVRIVSPADGAEIEHGTDIVVEIETEEFELGIDGNHWHIFVDGESRGMITGIDYDEVVRGLEPGDHELGAFLSNGAHEELEDGATIAITVVE